MRNTLEINNLRNPGKDVDIAPGKLSTGFNLARSDSYAKATRDVPTARDLERVKVIENLNKLGSANYNAILEIGIGQGFGTSALLEYLADDGMIIGVDASNHMPQQVMKDKRIKLHVGALDELKLKSDSIDLTFSLAAFHHVPNKYLVLNEVFRVLKPGSYFMIVDVNHKTQAQEVFDYIVRDYCDAGHDADFLDEEWIRLLAKRTGFEHISSTLENTDWHFSNEVEMIGYFHDLLCLDADSNMIKYLMTKYLKPYQSKPSNKWIMPWSLGFHLLRKPV